MGDVQALPPPDGLRDKVAIALHDQDCGDRKCTLDVMGAYYRQADTAIAAAAPVLRQEGATTERQRIRESRARMSPDDDGVFSIDGRKYYHVPADLLGGHDG